MYAYRHPPPTTPPTYCHTHTHHLPAQHCKVVPRRKQKQMGAKRALQGQQKLLYRELHAQRGGTSAQQAGFKRQRQQRGAVGAEGEEDGSEEGLGTGACAAYWPAA